MRNVLVPAKKRAWLLLRGLRALREVQTTPRILLLTALDEFILSIIPVLYRDLPGAFWHRGMRFTARYKDPMVIFIFANRQKFRAT